MPQLSPAEWCRNSNKISSISKLARTFSINTHAFTVPTAIPSYKYDIVKRMRFVMQDHKNRKMTQMRMKTHLILCPSKNIVPQPRFQKTFNL